MPFGSPVVNNCLERRQLRKGTVDTTNSWFGSEANSSTVFAACAYWGRVCVIFAVGLRWAANSGRRRKRKSTIINGTEAQGELADGSNAKGGVMLIEGGGGQLVW